MLSNASMAEYKQLSQFETTDQLNEAVRAHLYARKHELTPAAVAVYEYLHRASVNSAHLSGIGVRCDKYATIAKNTGYSSRTIKRAVKSLVERGMIEKYETTRSVGAWLGGSGHNIYCVTPNVTPSVTPREEAETVDVAGGEVSKIDDQVSADKQANYVYKDKESNAGAREDEHPTQNFAEGEAARELEKLEREKAKGRQGNRTDKAGNIPQNSAESREIAAKESGFGSRDTYSKAKYIGEHADDLDATYAPVPEAFAKIARPFFDATLTSKLFRRVQAAYRRTGGLDHDLGAYMHEITAAMKRAVYALKTGRIRKDFVGYFYTAVKNVFDDVYIAELSELSGTSGGELRFGPRGAEIV
ncbi:helix-turn-helix domain-containing protein [Salicibibacter cibarius]|uniref:Helix-turn-helix domain-containing protein n=1 Tax=Salicibibacter cibarius TaxID=2743000 RepID=A0A7T6Z047_9BACI|nr:helix-turn-helix domain-containing protein [Salicibibacter cibarius]QQK74202.1 helix-turn-helix domain-containing protein [Salicibibacter cibarius]